MDSGTEEADLRIIPHIFHALSVDKSQIFVLSSDTDVAVLLLHFCAKMKEHGMSELYLCRSHTNVIPIHILAERLGQSVC